MFRYDLEVRLLLGYSVGYTRKIEDDKIPKKCKEIFLVISTNFPRPQIIRQYINKPVFPKKNFYLTQLFMIHHMDGELE